VKGSTSQAKVASARQYWLQASHPLPVSQASKNASATYLIIRNQNFALLKIF
jgi:hypothetical protein